MTCQEFDRAQRAYLAGSLSDADASAVEAHASTCDACGARLEAATRRDVSAFSPPLPEALRARTLAEVRTRRQLHSSRRPWWAGRIAAAAAGVAFSIILARVLSLSSDDAARAPAMVATQDTVIRDSVVSPSVTLAMLSSRDEFAALDAAILELERAIVASPEDAELRAFLASALAQRDELRRQVQDAA